MNKNLLYEELKNYLKQEAEKANLLEEPILIKGRTITSEEAIGNPERQDFPLLKGKESIIQADFKGSIGQAFTDSPGYFQGTLGELLDKPTESNFGKASFIAVLNAVLRYLGKVRETIHCKNEEPNECAQKLVEYLKANYRNPKIALIGLQPAILDYCQREFKVRIVDMDSDNIGQEKYGVIIEDADTKTRELLDWCDLVLATGSTAANGTIVNFLGLAKPVIFYGTTIAGTAGILGLKRFCACSK